MHTKITFPMFSEYSSPGSTEEIDPLSLPDVISYMSRNYP